MNKNKLLKSGIVFTLGNLLIQGVAFITLPIYTRVISQEVFGAYTLYFAWVSIFSIFIGLQTSGSLSSARVKFPGEYKAYAISSLTVSTVFFLIVLLIAMLFQNFFASILGLKPSIFFIMIIQSYTTYIALFFGNYFIQQQKSVTNLILSVISTFLNVAISLSLIFLLEDDYFARVIGGFVPSIFTTIIAFAYFLRLKIHLFHRKYFRFMISVSIPLIFHQLGYQLLNQQSRIMIGNMLSNRDVAIYSFGFSMGLIIQIVLNSMNLAWVPWYFDAKKNNEPYADTLHLFLAIGTFLTLGYLSISPELAIVLGGSKYIQSLDFSYLIVLGYYIVFLTSIPINIQFYHGNTKLIPVGTIVTAIINLVLNYLFIPRFGLIGASFAVVISYLCLLGLHHFITRMHYQYQEVQLFDYVKWLGIVSGYSILMNLTIHHFFLRWAIGFVMMFVFVFAFKNVLFRFIGKVRRKK